MALVQLQGSELYLNCEFSCAIGGINKPSFEIFESRELIFFFNNFIKRIDLFG